MTRFIAYHVIHIITYKYQVLFLSLHFDLVVIQLVNSNKDSDFPNMDQAKPLQFNQKQGNFTRWCPPVCFSFTP